MGYEYDDPALVSEMVATVKAEAAALALLQVTADLLWEQRDTTTKKLLRRVYDASGGVAGAVAKRADQVLDGLTPDELAAARQLLLRLVTPEGTRRVLPRVELLDGLDSGAGGVLGRLVQGRVLVVRKGPSGGLVELVHESLVRGWPKLSRWIDEAREDLAFVAEAGRAAELWQQRGGRVDELWRGEALWEGQRRAKRTTALPPSVVRFLEAGEIAERRRGRARRVAIGTAVLLLATIGAASLAVAFVVAEKSRAAVAAQQREAAARGDAELRTAEALREGAEAALARREPLEARAKLREALERGDSLAARALWRRLGEEPLVWNAPIPGGAATVAIAPDGKTVAAVGIFGALYLVDRETAVAEAFPLGLGELRSVAWSPTERQVYVASEKGEARSFMVDPSGLREVPLPAGLHASRIAVSPDGHRLATRVSGSEVQIWDLRARMPPLTLQGTAGAYAGTITFSPDGALVAATLGAAQAGLWDSRSGVLVRSMSGHTGAVVRVLFSPNGSLLATGSADRTARLWNVSTGEELRSFGPHSFRVEGLAFLDDGQVLATCGGFGATAELWRVATGERVIEIPLRPGTQYDSMAASTDGTLLAIGDSASFGLTLLSPTPSRRVQRLRGHGTQIWGIGVDRERAWSSGSDAKIRAWRLDTGEQTVELSGPSEPAGVSVSVAGQRLVVATCGNAPARAWSTTTLSPLPLPPITATMVVLDPSGKRVASADADRVVRIWDIDKGSLTHALMGHEGLVFGLAWAASGKLLATASDDGTARVWDAETGEEVTRIRASTGILRGVAFGRRDRLLAVASYEGWVRTYELDAQGRLSGSPEGRSFGPHPGTLRYLDIDPTGRLLAVPGTSGVARVWDIGAGTFVDLPGLAESAATLYLRFSPDGKLVVGGDAGAVRVWDAATGRPHWWAPIMLSSPPELYSHRGWRRLDEGSGDGGAEHGGVAASAAPVAAHWREAIDASVRFGRATPDRTLLCLLTYDERVQAWDMAADRRLFDAKAAAGLETLPLAEGCVVRSADGVVRVYPRSEEPREIAKGASAMALDPGGLLVAGTEGIAAVAPDGTVRERIHGPANLSAILGTQGGALVAGLANGVVEILPRSAAPKPRLLSLKDPPTAAVSALAELPEGILVVGARDGTLGLWTLNDGLPLERWRLHGPVMHLGVGGASVYAASELGDFERVSLEIYRRPWCDLLREVWHEVPIMWCNGRPVVEPPPAPHECATR